MSDVRERPVPLDPPVPLAPPETPPAYHPRALLLVGAFGPPIRLASIGGLVAGIAAGAVAGFGVAGSAPAIVVVVVSAAAASALGTVVGIALMPTTMRRAYEAFAWLGHRDMARFREATGARTPTDAAGAAEFLTIYPTGSVPPWIRAELLISLGRVAEARAELDTQPEPRAARDRLEVVALRAFADLVETGAIDEATFRTELGAFPSGSPLGDEAAVIAALTRTRVRLATGAPEPLEPLVRVRSQLGREATTTVLRDTWLPFARSLALYGITVGLVLVILGVAR